MFGLKKENSKKHTYKSIEEFKLYAENNAKEVRAGTEEQHK